MRKPTSCLCFVDLRASHAVKAIRVLGFLIRDQLFLLDRLAEEGLSRGERTIQELFRDTMVLDIEESRTLSRSFNLGRDRLPRFEAVIDDA